MCKSAVRFALLVLFPVMALAARVQQSPQAVSSGTRPDAAQLPVHFYRLDYVLEEVDSAGRAVNSRSFTTTASTSGVGISSFTAGSKIPIVTGSTPKSVSREVESEFQYIDIGTKITATGIHEAGDGLALNLHAEISSLATPKVLEGVPEPVIRQNVWNGDVLIPIGKRITVFKSDSLENTGGMQLEVTATRLD